jgi:hypothetical protein
MFELLLAAIPTILSAKQKAPVRSFAIATQAPHYCAPKWQQVSIKVFRHTGIRRRNPSLA